MPKVNSAALVGLSAEPVEIEADVLPGLPTTVIVGLPDAAVQEARERVRFAIKNSGASYPRSRVAINLAPADLPKNGSHYDLPIALAVLLNSGQLNFDPAGILVVGELALDGAVRPVVGLLSVILMAKERGYKRVMVPESNSAEASLVEGIESIAVSSLLQAIGYLQGLVQVSPIQVVEWDRILAEPKDTLDFRMVNGQEAVKRSLEIAAAGGHNILLTGPPGTGKTLLAKSLPSILPAPSVDEVLEVTKIYSIAGLLSGSRSVVTSRPFRSPHHSASAVSLVGGGASLKPGEISLAHRGVLFLDELPEFPRSVLENLRQPLEDGLVTVSRASGTTTFPAQFILVAAQNPCPCGYYGVPGRDYTCTPSQIMSYQRKVSGPLQDRIDLHMQVTDPEYDKLAANAAGEASAEVRKRVQKARDIQSRRFERSGIITNSEMGVKEIRTHCQLDAEGKEFIRQASLKLDLSARGYHRVLKLARTIGDLAGTPNIRTKHLAEAVQYRTRSAWN